MINKHFFRKYNSFFFNFINLYIFYIFSKNKIQTRLNARHVLLVYTFKKSEREALKLALSIAADPDASVEILVPRQEGSPPPTATGSTDALKLSGGSSNVGEAPAAAAVMGPGTGGRRWYEYMDVVVLSSLVFDMEAEGEEAWESVDPISGENGASAHSSNAGSGHGRLNSSGDVGSSNGFVPVDIEALDVVAGGASFDSLARLVQGLPNVRLLQSEDEDLWASALKEEAKDEHRLLVVGRSRKAFLDHDHHHGPQHAQHGPTTFEDFADGVAAPLLVVYPPPSTKHLEKQKQKRRSRRFSLPIGLVDH
jgi:hypothetical protein